MIDIIATAFPLGKFGFMERTSRSIEEIVQELETYHTAGYTKYMGHDVSAVGFLEGNKCLDIWDASIGKLRSTGLGLFPFIIPEDTLKEIMS
jgi:hypothetical protein